MATLIHRIVVTIYSSTDFEDRDGKPGNVDENTYTFESPDPDSLLVRSINQERLEQIKAEIAKNPIGDFFF
jgi:hypothetical protein